MEIYIKNLETGGNGNNEGDRQFNDGNRAETSQMNNLDSEFQNRQRGAAQASQFGGRSGFSVGFGGGEGFGGSFGGGRGFGGGGFQRKMIRFNKIS